MEAFFKKGGEIRRLFVDINLFPPTDIKRSFATKLRDPLPLPINKVMCMFYSIWFQVPRFEIYLSI